MQARLLRYAIKIGDCMDGFNFDSLKINMPEVNSAIKANLFAEQQQKNQQKHLMNSKQKFTTMQASQMLTLLISTALSKMQGLSTTLTHHSLSTTIAKQMMRQSTHKKNKYGCYSYSR